jgi:membrane protease YdiL (CAAX protease family)
VKRPQQPDESDTRRGILARPLDALIFLLPLMIVYEISSLKYADRVIAFDLMRMFFELFGYAGMLAPGLGVVAILLATHLVSGEKWAIHWDKVGMMYVEAVLLALPLLGLNLLLPLSGIDGEVETLWGRLALSIGAGVYEELIFRLVLISVVMIIGADLFKFKQARVVVVAVALSSLAFAAHHHQPIGAEPFDPIRFVFRAVAGAYLAAVFWYRGYGPAAGCHAAYNVALLMITPASP